MSSFISLRYAILWMAGALLSFAGMAIGVRELVDHMGVFQILFFRSAGSLVLVLVLARLDWNAFRTRKPGLHALRNGVHFAGQYAWVHAIAMLPLATVFAIEFTMPVWTALLAALLLGERLTAPRMAMLVLGLAGILIILRPGLALVQPAALVMLLGSLAFAASMIATKRLTATDTPLAVLFWMAVLQMPLALFPALPGWVAPSAADLPWLSAVAVLGFTSHYCMTRAFVLADASVVVPMDFLRLPLIGLVGAVAYGEAIEPATFIGAAVIFAGTYYCLSRETRKI
jgi:drug/metabolite transporter (DMT)-like permease